MARTGSDRRQTDRSGKPAASDRDARLKAALKANLARRKAQARARSAEGADNRPDDTGDTGQSGEG
jgi:hypothetical protein